MMLQTFKKIKHDGLVGGRKKRKEKIAYQLASSEMLSSVSSESSILESSPKISRTKRDA